MTTVARPRKIAAVEVGSYWTDGTRLMLVTSTDGDFVYIENCFTGHIKRQKLARTAAEGDA